MTLSKLRPILAAVAVTGLAAWAALTFRSDQRAALARIEAIEKSGRRASVDYEARFAPLRLRLDKDSVVGYLTSPQLADCITLDANGQYRHVARPALDAQGRLIFDTRGYYKTRWVLSPMRVVWDIPCERSIGDFYDERTIAFMLNRAGYDIEEDFGGGVMLLKRRGSP